MSQIGPEGWICLKQNEVRCPGNWTGTQDVSSGLSLELGGMLGLGEMHGADHRVHGADHEVHLPGQTLVQDEQVRCELQGACS